MKRFSNLPNKFYLDPDGAIAKVIKEAEEVWKPFITPEVRYTNWKINFSCNRKKF